MLNPQKDKYSKQYTKNTTTKIQHKVTRFIHDESFTSRHSTKTFTAMIDTAIKASFI